VCIIKYYSTTALAKFLELAPKALFAKLKEVNYIVRESDKWILTAKGKLAGGRVKTSVKLGDYVEWPENFDLAKLPAHSAPDKPVELITSTKIGKVFDISANKLNYILSELGWVDKSLKGWVATEQGIKQGAVQNEDTRSGVPYVLWPATLSESSLLLGSIFAITGSENLNNEMVKQRIEPNTLEFREKFAAKHRATDGHYVRSKAEMLIDNWLYMAEIVHAYERKLPIEENVYCDFYIPTGKVYIEYWGYDNDPKYLARKEKKLAIYAKYGFKLIQLDDKDVQNLDDILPRFLLKCAIQAY
jgi:very-short-patch-repair endonuclease